MNETTQLTASVVIVTKDRPGPLRNLLRSLVRQSLQPEEVLVVDNNSAQSYQTVFDEFRPLLPLRTVIEITPGIPAARNRGVQEAKGDIILFTDDDCEADPFWVENMVKPFYYNPYIGAVGGDFLATEKTGSVLAAFWAAEAVHRLERQEEER